MISFLSRLFSAAPAAPEPQPAPEPIPPVIIDPLTARDRERLTGVHPDLVRVVELAARRWDEGRLFVVEGLRTPARQAELVRSGASKTQNSRHLTGHAVDLAWTANGAVPWNDWFAWQRFGAVVKAAAAELGTPIVWGGDWVTFRDGPHFELSRSVYPA